METEKNDSNYQIWVIGLVTVIFSMVLVMTYYTGIADERTSVCKYGWNGTMEGPGSSLNQHFCLSSGGKEIYVP